MKNRHSTRAGGRRPHERGAALILAIAIMTILLAIGLTFYAISRQEMVNANNVKNRVQADLLVDSALAIAMAEINRNFTRHPEATSLDHALFTKFNGSWAVGKQWALAGGVPLQAGGIPLVDMDLMPTIGYPDGHEERLFSGGRTAPWLYIPRIEGSGTYLYDPAATDLGGGAIPTASFSLNNPNRPPFATPAFYGPSDDDWNFQADIFSGAATLTERYPIEWIHQWTDVDNDGDGLNDAIWIPLARERFFSGGVFDEGGATPFGNPAPINDDRLDNDLDGMIDESNENSFDDDGDGIFVGAPVPADDRPDNDENLELASFVYHGLGPDRTSGDGLDNDGDGAVDEADEDKFFLAAPLPELVIPVDLNADGLVPDLVPNGTGGLVPLTVTLPNSIVVDYIDAAGNPQTANLTVADVDALDNDYDMLVNDYHVYAYVGPNTQVGFPPFGLTGFEDTGERYSAPTGPFAGGDPIIRAIEPNAPNSGAPGGFYSTWLHVGNWFDGDDGPFEAALLKAYQDINVDTAFGGSGSLTMTPIDSEFWSEDSGTTGTFTWANIRPYLRITHSGEPVCDLVGRAAITVRDESARINMNVAGAHTYEPILDDNIRSLGVGVSPAEIDTRILPDIGVVRSANMWELLNGTPQGVALAGLLDADSQFPGYGRVDDNANILLAALNNRDDDGDGLIDEGLRLPPLSDPLFLDYYAELGAWEGVDEPAERQRFRPLPNLQAEDRNSYNISGAVDGIDNDGDGVINERGELGDLQLKDTQEIRDANGIGETISGYMRHSISAYSTDRNANFVAGASGIRAVNRLDYNFATPQQIAANLLLTNSYQVTTNRGDIFELDVDSYPGLNSAEAFFANGLLQGDVHIRSREGILGPFDPNSVAPLGGIPGLPADGILQAMQAAVDIVDNRDRDHSRSVLTTERQPILPSTPLQGSQDYYDRFPLTLSARERIPETEFLPLSEIQAHLRDAMDVTRKLEFNDDWWTYVARDPAAAPDGGVIGLSGSNPEQRTISYSTSGNEAVRINEIMVRPVRRIEAEATPDPTIIPTGTDPVDAAGNPNNFDPTPFAPTVLPEFDVTREAEPGWVLNDGGFLGDTTTVVTDTNEDIIEFTFQSSTGLPAGRYYLTIDTTLNGLATVLPTTDPALPVLGTPVLQSAVKYVDTSAGGQPGDTIIEDDGNGVAVPFQNIEDAQIGGNIPGAPEGWAFVDGTRSGVGNGLNYHFDGINDGITDYATASGQETFAVTVPDASSDFELHIAFRMNPTFVSDLVAASATYALSINALDFSQEPDHEWVELVNVSDETIDISGWELEVGIPDRPGVPSDPFKSRWIVRNGSRIAPGGMVLLSVSKFDYFQDGIGGTNRIFDNGMGLADSDTTDINFVADVSNNLTVPRVFDDTSPLPPTAVTDPLFDASGSVFYRPVDPNKGLVDYVDRDGDGHTSYAFAQDTDSVALESSVSSSAEFESFASTPGDLPWDRIIQLDPISVVTSAQPYTPAPIPQILNDIQDVDDVAAFVLRGGVFPNYPERDGVDNDGDGGYFDPATGIYVLGTLEQDMVDNDMDGLIDERGVPDPVDPTDFSPMRNSEGVDEGNIQLVTDTATGVPWVIGGAPWRRHGAGSFEQITLPQLLMTDRSFHDFIFSPAPPLPPVAPFGVVFDGGRGRGIDAIASGAVVSTYGDDTYSMDTALGVGTFITNDVDYVSNDDEPADWKAFQERRWYPGDNVIVTLYEGPASGRRVVDRVTYREYDVINRTVDDIAPVPYADVDLNGNTTIEPHLGEYAGLHPDYPGMWRPNQMGLDFYRSLERKHPLYNGDRFGTENRWQATDGNYDDWSDSLSYFEVELAVDDPTANPMVHLADTLVDPQARFDTPRQEQLFRHAMHGSPLRMNAAARHSENPPDLALIAAATVPTDPTVQFPNPLDYYRSHEDGNYSPAGVWPADANTSNPTLQNQAWNHGRTLVANRAYQSPGDLMRVPHQMYLHDAVNTTGGDRFLRDMTMLNINLQADSIVGESVIQDIALRGTTLGQDETDQPGSGNLLREAVNSMAQDSMVLTMGQAEFTPIWPELGVGDAQNQDVMGWIENPGGSDPDELWAPATWAPVFLFELPNDTVARSSVDLFPNYPSYDTGLNLNEFVPLNYLFNANYMYDNIGAYYTPASPETEDRWNLESRVAMYVSQHRPPAAGAANLQQPEGLWTWDGADGLENGEYILYVGTFVPEMADRIEAAAYISTDQAVNDAANDGVTLPGKANQALLALNSGDTTNYQLGQNFGVEMDRVTASILRRDPTGTNPFYQGGQRFNPKYAIDVITDPTEAAGRAPLMSTIPPGDLSEKPPGLIHPADWNPSIEYEANDDGYIFYGNNAVGGWRPQIVRVTDNFLALRVRNLGSEAELGALTHIVLAPRKRTAGRLNVNTAESRVVPQATNTLHEYVSPLMGLPGVVDVARTIQPSSGSAVLPTGPLDPLADVSIMDQNSASPTFPPAGVWSNPGDLYDGAPLATPPTQNWHDPDVTTDLDLLVPATIGTIEEAHRIGTFRLNAMLMAGRKEHADGRYYESVGDLLLDSSGYDYNYAASRADIPDLSDDPGETLDVPGVDSFAVYPLSNESLPPRRFDEVYDRFRRLGNSVTVRSDVYKIIMTVETGYGVDQDNDGILNYRDPNEFVTTARTKASAIYERRTPSDESDGG